LDFRGSRLETIIEALLSVRPSFPISLEKSRKILLKMEHPLSHRGETGIMPEMTKRELDQFSDARSRPPSRKISGLSLLAEWIPRQLTNDRRRDKSSDKE
jgi:hypothetical protein